MPIDERNYAGGGMDQDSAPEYIAQGDYIEAYNLRSTGTAEKDGGYLTNIESNEIISLTLPDGINKCVAVEKFEDVRKSYALIYNSQGKHLLTEFDYDTSQLNILYTNLDDSGGEDALPLNTETYPRIVSLIDDKHLCFINSSKQPCIINIERLRSGGYGTLSLNDFLLIKAQPENIITPEYGNDSSISSNLLSGKLFQFRYQYIYLDNEPSAWSSISKMPVPSGSQENQTDVTKDNHLQLNIDISNDRVKEIRTAMRVNTGDWQEIKIIKREDVLKIQNTAIDVSSGIHEAYNPVSNEYLFTFYNNGLYNYVDVLETDLDYDYIPLESEAGCYIDGGYLLLSNNKEGYERPEDSAGITITYEDRGLRSISQDADAFKYDYSTGSEGSGDRMIYYTGTVRSGDKLTLNGRNRFTGQTFHFEYTVKPSEDGNNQTALNSFGLSIGTIPFATGTNPDRIVFKFGNNNRFVSAPVIVAGVSNDSFESQRSLKLNSSYQLGRVYYDKWGRSFPLITGENYKVKTLSFGISQGAVPVINWTINSDPPAGASTFQWVITPNLTHLTWLYINTVVLSDKGSWNAETNTPSVIAGTGTAGDYYKVSKAGDKDLGRGLISYQAGDYIVYNGEVWDRIESSVSEYKKGSVLDLTDNSSYILLYAGTLDRFNKSNSSSILAYDFSEGDRASFHYYKTSSETVYLENPSIDVEVIGFNPQLNIIKVRKPAQLNTADIAGCELMVEIYSPKKSSDSDNSVFYEIGEQFKISDGQHSVTSGTIKEGDCFIKTREYRKSIDVTDIDTYVVEDPNYSDFYKSNYYSFGRPHLYQPLSGEDRYKSHIRYSDVYNRDTGVNSLNRFYPSRVYGVSPGETSPVHGGVKALRQRDNILICFQELKIGYIPLNSAIMETQDGQQNITISDKLLNNIRYASGTIGIGSSPESLTEEGGVFYFIDPHNSEPARADLGGVRYISGKMSKYFKGVLYLAQKYGKKIISYFDSFNNEWLLSTETAGDIVQQVNFSDANWNSKDGYTPTAGQITITAEPIKGTVSYNSSTGKVTYTPSAGQTGADSFTFSFDSNGTTITKRVCVNIASGSADIFDFSFIDKTDQELNTTVESNTVLITGNNIPVPVSITGGEYRINDGDWTSADGMAEPEDEITVRVVSSSSYSAAVSAVLTVSGKSDSFDVTTKDDLTPDPFSFADKTGVAVSTLTESDSATITGITAPTAISIDTGEYQINGGSWVSTAGTISNNDTVKVRITSSASAFTETSATLTVGGVSGTFTVRTAGEFESFIASKGLTDYIQPAVDENYNGYVIFDNATVVTSGLQTVDTYNLQLNDLSQNASSIGSIAIPSTLKLFTALKSGTYHIEFSVSGTWDSGQTGSDSAVISSASLACYININGTETQKGSTVDIPGPWTSIITPRPFSFSIDESVAMGENDYVQIYMKVLYITGGGGKPIKHDVIVSTTNTSLKISG